MRKCGMILMDATPIIFLAKINQLDLLLAFDIPIYLPKEVEYETVAKLAAKENRDQNEEEQLIADFFAKQSLLKRVFIIKTLVCEIVEIKRREDPNFSSQGDGEVAANSLFLNRGSYGIDGPALLLYEDTDVKTVFQQQDVHFLTTYGLLVAMEKAGHIKSAKDEWEFLNLQYANNIAPNNEDFSNRGGSGYAIKPPK